MRIYADADGASHLQDVEAGFVPADFAPPAPPLGVSAPEPASRFLFLPAPPGWASDWHPVPGR